MITRGSWNDRFGYVNSSTSFITVLNQCRFRGNFFTTVYNNLNINVCTSVISGNIKKSMMDLLNDIFVKVPSTFWKKGRLETFENWPFKSSDNNCNPEKMASAGFYCIGNEEEPDLVVCFICSKQLDGWDPDDDPWAEHVKHQPSCEFVKLNKQIESSWTLDDLYSLILESNKKEYVKIINHKMNPVKEHMTELLNQIPTVCKGMRKKRKNT